MGFLDRAKKLAEQAKDMAEGAIKEVQTRNDQPSGTSTSTPAPAASASAGPVEYGTAYVPGMLGRPGWREQGLTDPAAVLPIKARGSRWHPPEHEERDRGSNWWCCRYR